jgi:hypothetical protein
LNHSGFSLGHIWALMLSGSVWFIATVRNAILRFLAEVDDDDSLGLQKFISWLEDGWTLAAFIFLIVLPLVSLFLFALAVFSLFLIRKIIERREEKVKVPCEHCQTPVHPCALHCPSCQGKVSAPRNVGVFGQAKGSAATDLAQHRMHLISRKRCPFCATRSKVKKVWQKCTACGRPFFEDEKAVQEYLDFIAGRLPLTLLICLLFSFVPLLGLFVGVIYYRLSLIAGLRGYVPWAAAFFTRLLVKIINLILIAFQWVPLLGSLSLPLMCCTNYRLYRRRIRIQGQAGRPKEWDAAGAGEAGAAPGA